MTTATEPSERQRGDLPFAKELVDAAEPLARAAK
jgi:hypothetical protein